MWTFVNLGMIILIIAAVIGLKMHLRWWNWPRLNRRGFTGE